MKHLFLRTAAVAISGSLVLTALAQSESPFAPVKKDPFTDVPVSHANYEAIEFLRENGVLRGYPDGEFKADRRINRAEFVYLITNPFILDTNEMGECLTGGDVRDGEYVYFPDVRKDMWYASSVCHAKVKDLINGYPDGTFQPGNYINFVEAAKIISNTFSLNVREEPGEKWYTPYVDRLDEKNAIPMSIEAKDQSVTRGEMAEMLYRLKENVMNKASRSAGSLK